MIVKILKSFGGIDFDFQKDEIVELDDTTANYYISIGYAEAYTGGGGGTGSADWGNITGNIDDQLDLKAKFNGKVDKDGTKVLSTNDFTNECKALVQGSFQKSTDTSDNITEGSTKLLLTTTERTKIANAYIKGTDNIR